MPTNTESFLSFQRKEERYHLLSEDEIKVSVFGIKHRYQKVSDAFMGRM